MRFEFLINFRSKQFVILLAIAYVIFSLAYFLISIISPMQGVIVVSTGNPISIFDSFYFSLCTISKSCYGELMPWGISRILGSLEVITGLILFGMFISKLVGTRTAKMLEKVYEMQFKQKLREHRNTWADQRACLDKISMLALNPKISNAKKEGEIAFHIKNKTAENHLKI